MVEVVIGGSGSRDRDGGGDGGDNRNSGNRDNGDNPNTSQTLE
jgi:hypothetical protein